MGQLVLSISMITGFLYGSEQPSTGKELAMEAFFAVDWFTLKFSGAKTSWLKMFLTRVLTHSNLSFSAMAVGQ